MLKRLWFLPVLALGACAPAAWAPTGEALPAVKGYLPHVAVTENEERTFQVDASSDPAVVIGREITLNGQPLKAHLWLIKERAEVKVRDGGVVRISNNALQVLKDAYPSVPEVSTQQFYKFCYLPGRGEQCLLNVLSGGVALYFNPLEEEPIVQVYGEAGPRNFTELAGRGFLFTTSLKDFAAFLKQIP